MVLADRRFQKKRNQLPRWIADEILEGQTGLSTDAAVGLAKKFLRNIAQPLPKQQHQTTTNNGSSRANGNGIDPATGGPVGGIASLKGKDSWTLAELEIFQAEQRLRRGEGHEGREDAMMHDYMINESERARVDEVNGHGGRNGDKERGDPVPIRQMGVDEYDDGIDDEALMEMDIA